MIGQGVGLEFLIPLAIEALQRDALAATGNPQSQ